jgi:hypothetical protein
MPEFNVTWEINLDADSPQDAAKKALEITQDQSSLATVFSVTDQAGNQTKVDVRELPSEMDEGEAMYAVVETVRNAVRGVTLRETLVDAIDRACDMGEENGLCETAEAKQEVLDALGSQGYYERGDYRVTIIEVT